MALHHPNHSLGDGSEVPFEKTPKNTNNPSWVAISNYICNYHVTIHVVRKVTLYHVTIFESVVFERLVTTI